MLRALIFAFLILVARPVAAQTTLPVNVETGCSANKALGNVDGVLGCITTTMDMGTYAVAGLLDGLSTALGLNSWACHEFDGTGWVQTQSGGLL